MPEKFDRLVAHIKREYTAKGYSDDRAEQIAYATANKVKHEPDGDEQEDDAQDESAEEVSADE